MKLGYIFVCNVNLVRIYELMHGLRSSGQTFRPWAGAGSPVLISYKRIRLSRQCLREGSTVPGRNYFRACQRQGGLQSPVPAGRAPVSR